MGEEEAMSTFTSSVGDGLSSVNSTKIQNENSNSTTGYRPYFQNTDLKLDPVEPSSNEIERADKKLCAACHQPIAELIIWALNKPYHCKCFVCIKCKESIAFRKFKIVSGKLFLCYKDYHESYQRCRICQLSVDSPDQLDYKNLYHPRCFICVNCLRRIEENASEELFDETYCRECARDMVKRKFILHSHYKNLDRNLGQNLEN